MVAIARRLLTAGALILAGSTVSPSLAQTGADFFKGKAVTYIVATAPGGGYDLYGRLVSEYMQKYLPGSTFIVKNVPGAGNIVGTNLLFASKPDGLTIGTFNTGLIYNQLIKADGVKFDRPYSKLPSGLGVAFITDPWGTYIELNEGLRAF